MPEEAIQVKGARVNNLKNISFSVPINQMTVVTGVSGSGKSSLAFDTIYAEGQRRYVESLSAYARQFLERMDKPDVDEVRGIAPAIAIRQKNSTRNPRSTVGTQTEIYDYLRLLFARVGRTFCRLCAREVYRDSPESIASEVLAELAEGTRFYVLFPASSGQITQNGDEADLRQRLKAPSPHLDQDLYVADGLKTGRVMVKDEDVCLHCGLCAERCPTGAWDMQKYLIDMTHAGTSCQSKSRSAA